LDNRLAVYSDAYKSAMQSLKTARRDAGLSEAELAKPAAAGSSAGAF
jgi:hypothetical protein